MISFQGEVWLHASLKPADDYQLLRIRIENEHGIRVPEFDELPKGGICGRAMFELPVWDSLSPWFAGPCGYPIFSAESVRFVKCKGTVTPLFWEVPATIQLPV